MSNSSPIHVQNAIPTTNFFVYEGRSFPFNKSFFDNYSNYFTSKNIQVQPNSSIQLFDNDEDHIQISDDSINNFINFCHGRDITFDKENVYSLHRLSIKYDVKKLIELTENYINENRDEIVIPFLLMNESEKNELTAKYEEIVSNDLEHYINDKNLLLLHVSTIYRVLTQYQKRNNNHTKKEIIEFLFKYFRKHKKAASVLFENIDFSNENIEFLKTIYTDDEISKSFDFHCVNKEYHKSVYDLHNEILRNANLMKIKQEEIKNENEQLKKK